MTLYIGVDFHPYQQTISWVDTTTGETATVELAHDLEKVRAFYASLPEPAVVGIEASVRAEWFENMLFEMGHKLLVGNPVLIRKRATSRHKSDRRDSALILELLLRDEFPAIWRRPQESNEVLEILRLRHSLVRQRTRVYNQLHSLARNAGLPKGRIRSLSFQRLIKSVPMSETGAISRLQLFTLMDRLTEQITELEVWLKEKARVNEKVQLLLTQKGVGYLAALCTVHTLGDVSRFPRLTKQVASYAGLEPVERSSAGRRQFGSVSKGGSALLRFQVGQAAQITARFDPRLKSFYKRLAKKKPRSVAKVATARKLLVKLSIMLRDGISAYEFDQRGRTVGNARFSRGPK
jgi:transposase